MSGVVEPVTLDQAIGLADTVVIAVSAHPPERVIVHGITPGGGPSTDRYPAFREVLHRFRVEEVLTGGASAGSVIEVKSNSGGVTLDAHRRYHVEKVHKILTHIEYASSFTRDELTSDPRRILLIRRTGDGWMFAAGMSMEPVRLRGEIEKRLRSRTHN